MKITRIETFLVPPRWLFCRIETDEGIIGWGEPVIEGRAHTVRSAVQELEPLLLGQDPLRVEDLWQLMTKSTFYRGGPILSSAVAGIDQALWDIAGKFHGVPVHELFGGPVRDRVRTYAWVGGDEPERIGDHVREQMNAGLTAVKMNIVGRKGPMATPREIDGILERAAAARDALGPDGDFALDCHGRLSLADCRQILPELTSLRPLFVEEPLLPEHIHLLPQVTALGTPVATGERLFSRHAFLPAFQAGIAVAQPDISHAGGITELRRIASMGEVWNVQLAPHCPLGPIALASSLQVGFSTPNFLLQEQSLGIHYNKGAELLDYLVDTAVFKVEEGYIQRLTRPGLGIEVNEDAVRAADLVGHDWHSPVWRDNEGAFTEW